MPRVSRGQMEKIRSAFGLVGPMGDLLELTQAVLEEHHPAGVLAEDCPICVRHQDEMLAIIRRWRDAQARVMEHWEELDGES